MFRFRPCLIVMACVALWSASASFASTYYVSLTGDNTTGLTLSHGFRTIQAGITTAQSGDVVLVANATYRGGGNIDLDFGGKAITLQSVQVGGTGACVIDCQKADRAFYFHHGETSATIVRGFTILNGKQDVGDGGGISIVGSNPMIVDCVFRNCTAQYGGGMGIDGGSTAVISDCTFQGNIATGTGGGLEVNGSAPTLLHNTFLNNSSTEGGGLMLYYGDADVINCNFAGNKAMFGGGVSAHTSNPTITNCDFHANSTSSTGGGLNITASSKPIVTNCTFTDNTSTVGGGAVMVYGSIAILTNCTLARNSSTSGGGIGIANATATITNCILWGDSAPHNNEVMTDPSTPSKAIVTYSDVRGGFNGVGNIRTDPLFVSLIPYKEDLHLQPLSPCIHKGSGTAPDVPSQDKDGNLRNTKKPSIGAYE